MAAISVEHISKQYGETKALESVSFEVKEAELFGLIGPDGAGKSTLFRILTTLLLADEGEAYVAGHHVVKDYKEIRKKVGYMPGKFSLYQDLSVEENLSFFATIFGTTIEENYELIKDIYVQIEPFKKRPAGKLSGGMKQKLALCCALIHKPEVLFLDEPTTGVDAVSRKEFWEMLKQLKAKGITILVSTPYMDEASLCDRIALIQSGKILTINTPKGLMNEFTKPLYAVKAENTYKLLTFLRQQDFTDTVLPFGEFLHLTTEEDMPESEIENHLKADGFEKAEVKRIEPTVEDIFLALSSETE
ncbi:ABC transporter ATP-binding protein [Limibacter armeniacum]|uniref:ABC transporter ATP-binding protein n=1 Tax=Limibacter armeniacum TaxID=466084 RepID=UPI002FE58E25